MYQEEINAKKNKICLKCSICNKEITGKHRFVKLAISYGVICQECNERFNDAEIELASNLFIAFGGYFGSRKGAANDSGYKMIKKLSNLYKNPESEINLNSLDVKIVHQALLHGILPNQFVRVLQLIVDNE